MFIIKSDIVAEFPNISLYDIVPVCLITIASGLFTNLIGLTFLFFVWTTVHSSFPHFDCFGSSFLLTPYVFNEQQTSHYSIKVMNLQYNQVDHSEMNISFWL
ncbi:hypothetical protein GQX74_011144 [Glossina fuscipes]|nr:hypothetical protein GQX74_011144 [Glossina fuscipes]